jgi:hypothetical protein
LQELPVVVGQLSRSAVNILCMFSNFIRHHNYDDGLVSFSKNY